MNGTSANPGAPREGRKTFIPLENNPAVLEPLAHRLGLSRALAMYDIFTLDDTSHVPRPAHALIFLVHGTIYHRTRALDFPAYPSARPPAYAGCGPDEPVLWMKQTIGHACGLMAVLHATLNGPAREHILPGSELERLRRETLPLPPEPRAQVLYDSEVLEREHARVAVQGDTAAPAPEEENYHHFIAFVKGEKDGRLWELEGGWSGPIDRGELGPDEDVLSEKALGMGVQKFVDVAVEVDDLEFSLVALAPAQE